MADTVPISDVLCEATEYLSKLGSNLRIRSESLREKRLRRGKLRNAHAVQKAANKVLLICELSKKSILNVEVGVKKILTQIDASQSSTISDTEKISEVSSSTHSVVKYEYIHYDSQRLRIKNKINLNHFLSVKVLAKAMSPSVYDKHPVYYNCKLYRSRRKEAQKIKADDADIKLEEEKKLEDKTNNYETSEITVLEQGDSKKSTANDFDSSKNQKLNNEEYQSGENSSDKDVSVDKTSKTNCLTEDISNKKTESRSSDKVNGSKREHQTENIAKRKPTAKTRKKFKHIKVMDSSDDDTDEKSTPKEDKGNKELHKEEIIKKDCDKENNIKVVSFDKCDHDSLACKEKLLMEEDDTCNESVEDALIGQVKNCETGTNSLNIDILETVHKNTVSLSQNMEQNNKSNAEVKNANDSELNVELAKQQLINSGSDSSDADNNEENESTKEASVKLSNIEISSTTGNTNKELDPIEDSNQDSKDSGTNTNEAKVPESEKEENSMCSTDFKPLIKCVNINKLLREDKLIETKKQESLIEIIDSDSDKETKKRSRKARQERDKNKMKSKIKKKSMQGTKRTNRKLKETDESDDEDYWKQKRKEVKEFQHKEFVINITRLPKLTDKYLHVNNLNRITENGSVVCSLSLINEPENDSQDQSESNVLEVNLRERVPEIQSSLDCEEDKCETRLKDDSDRIEVVNDRIKTSLLNASTDEESRTPNNKRKRESESKSPPSKRKHIMESMHAKKMLLTYSSSSDTDDEQLRNALKEIRDSLLKGASDEEEDVKGDKVKKTLDFEESYSNVKPRKLSQDSKHSSSHEEKTEAKAQESDTSTKETNSQVNENVEEQSNPSVKVRIE